jgi:hypothetical protein
LSRDFCNAHVIDSQAASRDALVHVASMSLGTESLRSGECGPVDLPDVSSEGCLGLFYFIKGGFYYSVVGVGDLLAHLPVSDTSGVVRHCDIDDPFANVGSKCWYCTRIKYEHVVSNDSLFHLSSSI